MKIRKRVVKKIRREFQGFKRKMFRCSSKEELWEACGKIHFYSCIMEYFELNERIPKGYLELVLKEPCFIEQAWKTFLKYETLHYQTWEDIDKLIEEMLMGWKLPLAA